MDKQETQDYLTRIQRSRSDETYQEIQRRDKTLIHRFSGTEIDNGDFKFKLDQIRAAGRTPVVISSFEAPIPSDEIARFVNPDDEQLIQQTVFLRSLYNYTEDDQI